jgi:glycosyltransferase involved in cell wall biosynthesis
MKIAIASIGDPCSVKTWSGIPFHIVEVLQKRGHEVHGIEIKKPSEPWYYQWLRRYYHHVKGKWFLAAVEERRMQQMAQQFDEDVAAIKPDVVLAIHGDILAYTTFKEPAVIIHDTTFASLLGYYPDFSNLTARSIKAGNKMYQDALDRAAAAVFSASWASDSALTDYHTPASKVYTIPLGANLKQEPSAAEVRQWIASRKHETCHFLFLGIDWRRKGGPDTLKFVAALNKQGIASHLTIVGCNPDIPAEYQSFVTLAGFLRKDVPEEAQKLEALLKTSHALILPSLAECYGCVYCEANAYGLPALGRDTGGIPEIIKDGLNGLLLGQNESAEAFARRWATIWKDENAYVAMSQQARTQYEERLNYDVFAAKLEAVIKLLKVA